MAQQSVTRRLRQLSLAALAGFPERRVLLVSDNRDELESDAVLFAAFGQWLQRAYDVSSALDLAIAETPDLVFVDLDMRDTSALDVVRQLRTVPTLKGTRFIAYADPQHPEDRVAACSAAFDEVLRKPVALSTLLKLLR